MYKGYRKGEKAEKVVLKVDSGYGIVSSAQSLCAMWIEKGIKKAMNCFMACGDKWTRTTDSRIFSPMLYQLSYITLFVK